MAENETPTPPARVVITDIEIPFGSIMGLMLKVVVAAVPVALILLLIYVVATGLLLALSVR